MVSPILAFRPASVVARLPPRSGACPLSARELLGAASDSGAILPIVRAPVSGIVRGALVAAKEQASAIGLAIPAGVPAGPWFDAVARAADELAAGLPLLLAAEVVVPGEGGTQVERALSEAWQLLDAGLTHLSLDVSAVEPGERGRVAGEVGQAAIERGLSLELAVPLGEGAGAGSRLQELWEEIARAGAAPDAAGVRCPAPADDAEARVQAAALARLSQALAGVPVVRRGPVTPRLLELLGGSPVRACEDGGAAAERILPLLPLDPGAGEDDDGARRVSPLERAASELSGEAADRLEARVYVDVLDLVEPLGAGGSALAITRALERRLVDR